MVFSDRRKELNQRQKELRQALTQGTDIQASIQCFLTLHGMLHSADVAPEAPWSYEDLLLDDLDEAAFRKIPEGQEHSVVWIVWHLSRVEDVTMNLLVAGRDQVFTRGGWLEKIHAPFKHTGNGTGIDAASALSKQVDISALRAYRFAVGQTTRQIISGLTPQDLKRKMDPLRLQRIIDEGAVIEAGSGVVEYWSRRDVTGLLLMPPTRHTIVHWNEAHKLIQMQD